MDFDSRTSTGTWKVLPIVRILANVRAPHADIGDVRFPRQKGIAMWFPKLPGRCNSIIVSAFLAAWTLVALSSFCFSAEPVLLGPTLDSQEKTPVDKKPAKSEPPQGFPYSPLRFDEDMWGTYLERQNEYLVKLGEVDQGPPERKIHVFADGGFFMMHTYFSRPNPAFIISGKSTAAMPSPNFEFHVDFAPVVNLTVINDEGWGVRGTWQQLDESVPINRFSSSDSTGKTTVSSVPVFGVPGFTTPGPVGKALGIVKDKVNFSDHLRFTDFDTEIIKEFRWGPWLLLTGGGVRYLYLSQSYDAFRINTGTVTKTTGSGAGKTTTTLKLIEDSDRVDSGRNFGGAGPAGILEVHYRLGRFPVWLYGNANGAVFFGREETESFERTVERLQTTVKKGTSSKISNLSTSHELEATTSTSKVLTTADFEVGVNTAIPYGRVLLLLRVGLAEQIIFDGGNATSPLGNTEFFGMRFTAGVSY